MASSSPVDLRLRGTNLEPITVEDFANYLRDLVFLHDRLWVISHEKALSRYNIGSSYFYSRTGRPVPGDQRLELASLGMASPWNIVVVIAAGLYSPKLADAFTKIIRDLVLLPGDLRKQTLEVAGLQLDNERKALENKRLALELREYQRAQLESQGNERLISEVVSELTERNKRGVEEETSLITRDIRRLVDSKLLTTDADPSDES